MTNQRHTNAEIQAGIESLEADGWTINRDGTITRVKTETKKEIRDPRLVNAAPRHVVTLPDRTQFGIKVTDLVLAKFGRIAAIEQPDEAKVESQANLEPETCPEPARVGCDEAVVGQGLSFAPETRTRPAGCTRCGGHMVRGDDNEWKCVQCGRRLRWHLTSYGFRKARSCPAVDRRYSGLWGADGQPSNVDGKGTERGSGERIGQPGRRAGRAAVTSESQTAIVRFPTTSSTARLAALRYSSSLQHVLVQRTRSFPMPLLRHRICTLLGSFASSYL